MLDRSFLCETAEKLRHLANQVEQVPLGSSMEAVLSFSEIRNSYPKDKLAGLIQWSKSEPFSASIYSFSAGPGVSVIHLHKAYKEAKENKLAERAYARLHEPSPILYVGSSRTLESRIKQHLGYAHKAIFAMQLCYWLPDTQSELTIKAFRFGRDA